MDKYTQDRLIDALVEINETLAAIRVALINRGC